MDFVQKTIDRLERSPVLAITLSFLILVLTIVSLWLWNSKPKSKKNVLLLGISNSGKTSLFCQLVYKTNNLLTQISIIPNSGVARIEKSKKEKSIEVVDIPGQDKIRSKFIQLYKRTTRAIIFVVDSSTFHKESKDVAQFLFEVLNDETITSLRPKILIVCNKSDVEFAKAEAFIRSNLEKEIELLRKISQSALKSTDNSSRSKSIALTSTDEKSFDFNDLKYFKVEFCEASCLKSDTLVPVTNWLLSNF